MKNRWFLHPPQKNSSRNRTRFFFPQKFSCSKNWASDYENVSIQHGVKPNPAVLLGLVPAIFEICPDLVAGIALGGMVGGVTKMLSPEVISPLKCIKMIQNAFRYPEEVMNTKLTYRDTDGFVISIYLTLFRNLSEDSVE